MRTIQQSVEIAGASAAELYRTLTDSDEHARLTGAPASITPEPGSRFTLFGGAVRGVILLLIPHQLVVKSWRGNVWRESDPDSIEIMRFEDTVRGARIELVHAVLPEQFVERWNDLYWAALRERFTER